MLYTYFFLQVKIWKWFLVYFPYFEKIKRGLWGHFAVCAYVSPLTLLGNDTVNTFPWRRTHKNRITVWSGVFYTVRVVSNIQDVVKGKQAISSSQNLFCLFVLHVIKPYGRMEIWLHAFFTSAVCGCKWLTPEEGASGAHWIRGSLGPETGLERVM
jgi:hypothetical protein